MLYKNLDINEAGHLVFAGFDTTVLAERYGTPLMLMDEAVIRARCREYKTAMAKNLPAGSRPLYASKSLSIKKIYEIMAAPAETLERCTLYSNLPADILKLYNDLWTRLGI